ncbi:MAG: PadR family transcriptional regulator, partial [Elusimicrobiota bacterium]
NKNQCRCTDQSFRIEGLVIPCLLLLLKNESAHGYKLREKLEDLPFLQDLPAPGVIYRYLRCLEEDGMVDSKLEPGEGGPARKVYLLTKEGESFLKSCKSIVKEKQNQLKSFLNLLKKYY